ncbi:YjaG family protein [Marinobacterium arenosum]|uniref:YjaG family protein n=1 Tax=Marinobacterium arenosum TaxID=2862496 RepID=UPI001C97B2AC|nr:YjaG family protein [Marinobacterium arenosum]MBY4676544.1 YjaG family protein [Marinobacterium arenosum]
MSELPQIDRQLKELKDWQLCAFCAALTERMFPNYALFSRLVEFGDAARLRLILDGVWDHLANTGAKMNFEVQLDHVEDNMPDLEEFPMYGASPALDAAVALFETLNCMISADLEEASGIANLSRECVATFIEVTESDDQLSDEELIKLINTHELMEIEDAFQQAVLDQLKALKNPNRAAITALRELAANGGISNIGISDDN